MLIAATGLTGFVGREIARRLAREGDLRIRALVRAGGRRDRLLQVAPEAEVLEGDVADAGVLARLVEGAGAVVHASHDMLGGDEGRRFRDEGPGFRHDYLDRNLRAGCDLIAAARLAGVRQFVAISSFSVYGRQPHEGPPITDDSAPRPNNPYSALKAAFDAFCHAFDGRLPDGVSILRPSLVIGMDPKPEDSNYWAMARSILANEPVEASGGTSTVRNEDVAEAVALAIRKPAIARGVVNLADRYTDVAEVAEILKEMSGSRSEIRVGVRRGEPTTPASCARAVALGVRFRGVDGLREHLARVLAAARQGAAPTR
ncbi:MAG: NAD(P)-dependent oxidoreductase [Planctomycetota bacterium]